MKVVLQRVTNANVTVENKTVGKIQKGLLIFLGVEENDTIETVKYCVHKIINLRIFSDNKGKMNLSLLQTQGELLVVSQFTLLADCSSGNRPSFSKAGNPKLAEELYEAFIIEAKKEKINVEHGIFGADMKIGLTNDGPVTILLEQ